MRYEMLAVFVLIAAVAWAIVKLPDELMKVFLAAGWAAGAFAVVAALWSAFT